MRASSVAAAPRHTARQDELIDLALEVVREAGLAGLTVRKLAERAGFTEAALYRHFPHKQALLLAMIERLSEERLLRPIRALAADPALTPRQRVVAVVRHHVRTVLQVDGLPVLILAEAAAAGDEPLLERFRAITGELLAIVEGLLAEAGGGGGERPSPRALALTFFGLAAATALYHRLHGSRALEREASERLPAFVVERLLGPERPRRGKAVTARRRGARRAALCVAVALLVGGGGRLRSQELPPPASQPPAVTAAPLATPAAATPPVEEGPAAVATSQAPSSLSLADAVARVLAAAPPVAAARAAEGAARAQLAEAVADLSPVLGLAGSAFRHQKPALVTPIHGFSPTLLPSFDRTVFQGTLQLRYDLWDGGLRSSRIAEREARLEAAQAATAAAEVTAGARAITAFLALLTLDEQLTAHGERDAALAAERSRVEQLLAVGRAAPVDVLRVQAAQASAAADRVAIVAGRERVGRDLQRLLGDDPQAATLPALLPATLATTEPPPRQALLARALAGSGEVERARRELAAAEAALDAARAARAPALRAEGNLLGFAGGNGDEAAEWNAGLRVAVPLWDRHLAARVALAEAARAGAAAGVRLAEDAVGSALDAAWAELAAATARAGSLAEAEAKNVEVVRIERLRLDAGAGVEADYLRAEADLLAARAAAVEARHRVGAARAELARVTGELSPAWVAAAFVPAERPREGDQR